MAMHAGCAIARGPAHQGAAWQQRMSGGTAFGRNFFEVSVFPQFRTHVRLSLMTERAASAARAWTVTGRVYAALLVASRTGPVGSLRATMAYVTLCGAARTWHPRSQVRADQHLGSAGVPWPLSTRSFSPRECGVCQRRGGVPGGGIGPGGISSYRQVRCRCRAISRITMTATRPMDVTQPNSCPSGMIVGPPG